MCGGCPIVWLRLWLCGCLVTVGLLFFFFQAEDGIRDATVTGVQTCALPIRHTRCYRDWSSDVCSSDLWMRANSPTIRSAPSDQGRLEAPARSEERRVGEEGRSRWSPDHLKNTKRS